MKHALIEDGPEPGGLSEETQNDPDVIVHEVVKGETLRKISNLYGVNYDKLIEDNNIEDPNVLLIGQQLLIQK